MVRPQDASAIREEWAIAYLEQNIVSSWRKYPDIFKEKLALYEEAKLARRAVYFAEKQLGEHAWSRMKTAWRVQIRRLQQEDIQLAGESKALLRAMMEDAKSNSVDMVILSCAIGWLGQDRVNEILGNFVD